MKIQSKFDRSKGKGVPVVHKTIAGGVKAVADKKGSEMYKSDRSSKVRNPYQSK